MQGTEQVGYHQCAYSSGTVWVGQTCFYHPKEGWNSALHYWLVLVTGWQNDKKETLPKGKTEENSQGNVPVQW